MKRTLFAIAFCAVAVSFFGCATDERTAPRTKPDQASTTGQKAKPLIKCSTCGVEFTTRENAEEHLKTHPEHQVSPVEERQ